jgi:hypothetical protein
VAQLKRDLSGAIGGAGEGALGTDSIEVKGVSAGSVVVEIRIKGGGKGAMSPAAALAELKKQLAGEHAAYLAVGSTSP